MIEKLKVRWGINSNFQILKIFVVFGITGSTAAWVTHPICDAFGITTENLNVFLYWTLRIILITVVYKFVLVFVAFIFGEFTFISLSIFHSCLWSKQTRPLPLFEAPHTNEPCPCPSRCVLTICLLVSCKRTGGLARGLSRLRQSQAASLGICCESKGYKASSKITTYLAQYSAEVPFPEPFKNQSAQPRTH